MPTAPSPKSIWEKRIIANKTRFRFPVRRIQTVSHTFKKCSIAFDPAITHNLALEFIRPSKSEHLYITLRFFDFVPS